LDPHVVKTLTQISVPESWKLIEEFADIIGSNGAFNPVRGLIDKTKYGYGTLDVSFLIDYMLSV